MHLVVVMRPAAQGMERRQEADRPDQPVQPGIARAAAMGAVMPDDRQRRGQHAGEEREPEFSEQRRADDRRDDHDYVESQFDDQKRDRAEEMPGDERHQIQIRTPVKCRRNTHQTPFPRRQR